MQSTEILGVVIVVLAGLVMGSSPWPLKLMREFKYEHFAFISMWVALIIVPWGITLLFCPNAIAAYQTVAPGILVKSNLFSLGFGVAQVLALLCFQRIGVSLTYGILTAVGASVGVITPMLFKGSGLFKEAPDVTSKAGLTVVLGVAIMLAGVCFASLAGFGREKARSQPQARAGGFALGLAMVVLAGLLSTGLSFAFVYSQGPILDAVKARGAGDTAGNFAVWAIGLLGAALVNVIYPAYLMTQHRSWKTLGNNGRELFLAMIYGLQFCAAIALVGKGMLLLGALGASVGWGTQQGMQILGGQALGFATGEWRGVPGRSRAQIYAAIIILIVAAIILAYGNSVK